jgi:hypothetical protein
MSKKEIIYPDKWGPHVWQALHYITLGYPENPTEDQKLKYKTFFILLKDTLPCVVCANHYAENLKKKPLTDDDLANKEALVKWLIDFHNVVNEMKGKPIIKYEDARRMIDTDKQCVQPVKIVKRFIDDDVKFKSRTKSDNLDKKVEKSSNKTKICILIAIFIGLVIIAVVYKKK